MSLEQVLKEREKLKKENPHPWGKGRIAGGMSWEGEGNSVFALKGALISIRAGAAWRGSQMPCSATLVPLFSVNMPVFRLGIFFQVLLLMNSTPPRNILLWHFQTYSKAEVILLGILVCSSPLFYQGHFTIFLHYYVFPSPVHLFILSVFLYKKSL